jgi:hypothetical protein
MNRKNLILVSENFKNSECKVNLDRPVCCATKSSGECQILLNQKSIKNLSNFFNNIFRTSDNKNQLSTNESIENIIFLDEKQSFSLKIVLVSDQRISDLFQANF